MPIYSDDEAEVEDRLASLLAGAGATTSLAASAAAQLRANPSEELPPRLRAALESTVHFFERSATIDVSYETPNHLPVPEVLLAKLAEESPGAEVGGNARDFINRLLEDLRSLLIKPTSEIAARVEQFLSALSQAENSQAQSLARGSLDLELLSLSRFAI